MAERVGLFGAGSLVGQCLLPLLGQNYTVYAFSRQPPSPVARILWQRPDDEWPLLDCLISTAPIWVLPEYFHRLHPHTLRRIVALSSTSRFSKETSGDASERELARRLGRGEETLRRWAENAGIEWVILRPTLIYGGSDSGIAEIARFIRRYRFFPLLGEAAGLRQPVHARDVAAACLAALRSAAAADRVYDLSGGEMISYREMVLGVFAALHRTPRLAQMPLWAFRLAAATLRHVAGREDVSCAMAQRMNRDLIFDHSAARRDIDFAPRMFRIEDDDLPS